MHNTGFNPKIGGLFLAITGLYALLLAPAHPLMAADASLSAHVTITRQGKDYNITTPIYQAQISGTTGLLQNMVIDGQTVIEKTGIDLENRPITQIDVTQESPTHITSDFTATDNGKEVAKALKVGYEAEDSTLYITTYSTVGRVSGRGMVFNIGHDAQMVRSLEFKDTVPMPVLQYRSPWMKVKYYFSNGSTLGIINEGAGNPFNANENGWVSQYQYGRGGYVANSEYKYTLVAEKGNGKRTIGSPSMNVVESSTPAVYWQGTPILVHLNIAKSAYTKLIGLPGLHINYRVQDVFENTVAQGSVPLDLSTGADPIQVKIELPVKKLGWYRAYFTVDDQSNSLLESDERLIFSVLKHQANMGESFANIYQTDYTIGLGLSREGVSGDPQQLSQHMAELQKEIAGTDVHLSYAIDGSPVGPDPVKWGQYIYNIFSKSPGLVPQVEIINEPNGTLQPQEYIDTYLRPAYDNIKKTSPTTRVLGPVLCGIGPQQASYLSDLYKLGLKNLTDGLTFHPYAGNFDDGSAVTSMEGIQNVIAANHDSNKPILFTEAGYGHGGWSDLPSMREIIKYLTEQYAWQDAIMGITYQQNYYYFTDQMGYLDFWLRSTQLTPAAVAMRTYTSFVKGQDRAQELSFGSLDVVRAFRFPGPNRQIIMLWTSGNQDETSTTQVAFKTSARDVEWFDCFGNPLPAKVRGGKIVLDVPTFPTYLTLKAKENITPIKEDWGTNVALASMGSIAESSSEQGTYPAVQAIDGDEASYTSWRSLNPNEFPQSITITLAGPTVINRVGIWSYCARGYNLEAMGTDGKWVTLATRRDQPYRRFRLETFKPITTDQVRLTIVDSYTSYAEVAEIQIFSSSAKGVKAMDLVNWALKSNGATATASSDVVKDITVAQQDWGVKKPTIQHIHVEAKADNAIDGIRSVSDWHNFYPTTWMAAPNAPLPQWLEVDFNAPHEITSIAVYTIAFARWSPADSGIRDWDVQIWEDGGWKTVDSITNNVKVSEVTRLKTPTITPKIRILVKGTNDPEGTVGIMEVEAYGPRK